MKKIIITIVTIIVIIFSFQGCLDDISEIPLEVPEEIDSPEVLSAEARDGSVLLKWRMVNEAIRYRLYRATPASPLRQIAETVDTFYIDQGVRNEIEYHYSVSSVSSEGFEGSRSETITAIPTVYSIMINQGDSYTNSLSVSVDISMPPTTIHMMIGNDHSFSNGVWENSRSSKEWILTEGDGVKHVYAVFRDQMGFQSPVVCDSITLDRYSKITEVSFSPNNPNPGATIHFNLITEGDETPGNAWIEVDNYTEEIQLYNNGRGGDQTPGDNVYEADYSFPLSFRGRDLLVRGNLVDKAGNRANPVESAQRIDFTDPPEPVSYIGVMDSTVDQITIRWEESEEDNFQYYRIYRDAESGVEEDPRFLVRELTNRAQTSYPDGDLTEGKTYYYRIFVVNDLEETAGSNELIAHTYDAIPDAVTLDTLSSVSQDRLTLTWSMNHNTDFSKYVIYRSTEPGVTTDSDSTYTISNREITFYDDEGIDTASNDYFYRVYVVDMSGKSSRSNEVSTVE